MGGIACIKRLPGGADASGVEVRGFSAVDGGLETGGIVGCGALGMDVVAHRGYLLTEGIHGVTYPRTLAVERGRGIYEGGVQLQLAHGEDTAAVAVLQSGEAFHPHEADVLSTEDGG